MLSASDIIFIQGTFPSANIVLIKDEHPTLIDSGFGSDIESTKANLEKTGIAPSEIKRIINTHYHSDHVGGNHFFQTNYHVEIMAQEWDASLINHKNPEACSAIWLDQPVEPYHVSTPVRDGDVIGTGNHHFQVIHTMGHTLGHISLYEPVEQILIGGDLFHQNDVGWLSVFREGAGAMERSLNSLERIAALPIKKAYSGHGPAIDHPAEAIHKAKERIKKWMHQPEKSAWHACKRIFAFTLMIKNGLSEKEMLPYLNSCPWYRDFAMNAFGMTPEAFLPPLIEEMQRSKAAYWEDNYLLAGAPYRTPSEAWMEEHKQPLKW